MDVIHLCLNLKNTTEFDLVKTIFVKGYCGYIYDIPILILLSLM